ncbi:alkylation response protein AidB-like acyl-CoA dehydrogenase [Gracilibacillus halotolerans]|uniref:Alkylation response protein AidB-like acyl-CoA dehydrogenase n=1 Tax=Gracilibacillus halotolerans TaxID=74386 RepID=A0A841RPI4_9BACI|nr:acyl-CoA dehydrogenase family protein [Gracilibacillus halotolerans]MBB6513777.1 alkylation response protein AidB-like acyl-CoA dehydrogenase [Gracilibacillus halotolerans]
MELYHNFILNDRHKEIINETDQLATKLKEFRKQADESATLPEESIAVLKEANYMSWTLPKEYGGKELSLYEFLLAQEKLAQGDGAVALSLGWHLGVVKELADDGSWDHEMFDLLATDIRQHQKLVNRIATEPATGSPTRGGIPETKAVQQGDHYILNGRKNFATMAEVLDYYIVTAHVEEKDVVGSFLIPRETPGIQVEKTWDTLGMRGTGSDDVLLQDVTIPEKYLVEISEKPKRPGPKGWLLHIPACYLGIAIAARNDIIDFAKNFQPNSLNTPISKVDHIQTKIGEMELKLLQARYFMYTVADKWDNYPEQRSQLLGELGAVKMVATNAANEIVDLAMRIAGGRGLSKSMPFEQYYRDVRAGLHNPPMDDMVIKLLAKSAINNRGN